MVKNFLIVLKNSATDAIKSTLKTAIQKTAEVPVDLIGNKIADQITSFLKKSTKELQNNETEVYTPKKKIYISKKRLQIIDELKLTSKERYLSPKERLLQIIDKLRLV